MWDYPKYGEWKDLRKELLGRMIVDWDGDKLVLDNGTVVEIVCSEQDCCACAGGLFKKVKLNAVITGLSKPKITDTTYRGDYYDGERDFTGVVTIYHNRNIIAVAEANADAGNGGYYYSVASFKIKDIHYKIVQA